MPDCDTTELDGLNWRMQAQTSTASALVIAVVQLTSSNLRSAQDLAWRSKDLFLCPRLHIQTEELVCPQFFYHKVHVCTLLIHAAVF